MCCNGYRSPPTSAVTTLACGRNARMTVCSPYSCAPRIACGSWWVPEISRCRSDGSGARYLLTIPVLVIGALLSLAVQQWRAVMLGTIRHVQDVYNRRNGVDTDVVRLEIGIVHIGHHRQFRRNCLQRRVDVPQPIPWLMRHRGRSFRSLAFHDQVDVLRQLFGQIFHAHSGAAVHVGRKPPRTECDVERSPPGASVTW